MVSFWKKKVEGNGKFETYYNPQNGTLIQRISEDLEEKNLKFPSPNLCDLKVTDFCNLGCHFCAVPDSPVLTSEGLKAIQDLKVGDTVISYDTKTFSFVEDSIVGILEREYCGDILTFEFENGGKLSVTPDHPLLTQRGWLPAGELTTEDEIVSWEKDSV